MWRRRIGAIQVDGQVLLKWVEGAMPRRGKAIDRTTGDVEGVMS